MHEPGHGLGGIGVAVVLDALHEAAGAVADAGDGDTDRTTHDAVAPSCDGSGWSCTPLGGDRARRATQGRGPWTPCGAPRGSGGSGRRGGGVDPRAWARRSLRPARRRSSSARRASPARCRQNANFRAKAFSSSAPGASSAVSSSAKTSSPRDVSRYCLRVRRVGLGRRRSLAAAVSPSIEPVAGIGAGADAGAADPPTPGRRSRSRPPARGVGAPDRGSRTRRPTGTRGCRRGASSARSRAAVAP